MLVDALNIALGGALTLLGVWLHSKLSASDARTAEQRGRLADAAILWMRSVAKAAHVNHERQDEVASATTALTDAKFRLVVLGNQEIWSAMRRVERFPRFDESEEGREAFREVVRALRYALDPRGTPLDSTAIDELLLGKSEATVSPKEMHWA